MRQDIAHACVQVSACDSDHSVRTDGGIRKRTQRRDRQVTLKVPEAVGAKDEPPPVPRLLVLTALHEEANLDGAAAQALS